MPNLAIDQFSDPSFKKLAECIKDQPAFEPLIKKAHLDNDEHAALPNSAFAWENERLFPLHTAEHAALSYLYATSKTASVPAHVVSALTSALDVYGVSIPAQEKVAAAPVMSTEDYLLPARQRWLVTSAEGVKLAEQALRDNKSVLPIEEQAQAAVRLVKKAQAYDVELSSDTIRTAGLVMSDLDTVRHWVEVRANLAPENVKVAYQQLSDGLGKSTGMSSDRPALIKLASMLNDLDKQAGFDAAAGRKMYDPLATVFNTDKVAEETVDLAGTSASLRKLAMLPDSMYGDCFGDDVIPELSSGGRLDATKIAQVLPTMPRDLLQSFSRQIRAYL
jgi:hypothetical protein